MVEFDPEPDWSGEGTHGMLVENKDDTPEIVIEG